MSDPDSKTLPMPQLPPCPRFGRYFPAICLVVFLPHLSAMVAAAEGIALTPSLAHARLIRTKALVDAQGYAEISRPAGPAAKLPIAVNGELFFDESLVKAEPLYQATRYYWDAHAELTIGEQKLTPRLRPDRQLIVVREEPAEGQRLRPVRFVAAGEPMSREESELLNVPATRVLLERLLPSANVQPNDTWSHEDSLVAQLVGLEAVEQNKVQSKLVEVTDRVAKIELSGTLSGTVHGAAAAVELQGIYQFDRQARQIKWFGLTLKEKRTEGLTAPAFESVTRVRMAREAATSSPQLTAAVLARTAAPPRQGEMLDFLAEEDGFQLLLDQRWHLVSTERRGYVFRMLDHGALLATCTIHRLPRLPEDRDVTLETFQQDVAKALGKHANQILAATENTLSNGIRALRVELGGSVGDIPVQWIYYHLSDIKGNRISQVFTLEATQAEAFAGSDETLVSGVRFVAPPPSGKISARPHPTPRAGLVPAQFEALHPDVEPQLR